MSMIAGGTVGREGLIGAALVLGRRGGYHGGLPQTRWLETTEIYSLTVLRPQGQNEGADRVVPSRASASVRASGGWLLAPPDVPCLVDAGLHSVSIFSASPSVFCVFLAFFFSSKPTCI